jgi:hypothetical protein
VSVTVCIPTIPPRAHLLEQALHSVLTQTRPPDAISIVSDLHAAGPTATRNATLHTARTEWVAFLDDDDLLHPQHLQRLLEHQATTGADLVYPWFDLQVNGQPSENRPVWITRADGTQTDPEGANPDLDALDVANYIPVTLLVRRQLLEDVGGFQPPFPGTDTCEDWGAWRALHAAGATFAHLPERTWTWRHWGGNTGGRPWRAPTHAPAPALP